MTVPLGLSPPNLPNGPLEYRKDFFDQYSNVLRLFFRQLVNSTNLLTAIPNKTVSTVGTIVGLPISVSYIVITAATQIANLAPGNILGQEVTFLIKNTTGTCTFVNNNNTGGAAIKLNGNVNFVGSQYSTLTLFWDGQDDWVEKSRSVR